MTVEMLTLMVSYERDTINKLSSKRRSKMLDMQKAANFIADIDDGIDEVVLMLLKKFLKEFLYECGYSTKGAEELLKKLEF